MNRGDIDLALRQLHLPGIRATLDTRMVQAQSSQQTFEEVFGLVLQDELDWRRSKRIAMRFKRSDLDEKADLNDFDWHFNPLLPRKACFELMTLKFMVQGYNALIIGQPGTGKSRLAKSVAYQAILQGYTVLYVEADQALAYYTLSSEEKKQKLMNEYVKTDLLVMDDLFMAKNCSEMSADLFQLIVHKRYKLQKSIIVTSNRVIQDWGTYLGDNTASTTILDRLMHRSEMLEFEGKSYRMNEAASRIKLNEA